jgi:hypothetical protein
MAGTDTADKRRYHVVKTTALQEVLSPSIDAAVAESFASVAGHRLLSHVYEPDPAARRSSVEMATA